MKLEVKKAIKTPDGTVIFEGELSEDEHDFVLTVGLNQLLTAGALPFHGIMDDDEVVKMNPQSLEKQ